MRFLEESECVTALLMKHHRPEEPSGQTVQRPRVHTRVQRQLKARLTFAKAVRK